MCHYDRERTCRCEESRLSKTERECGWKVRVMNYPWEEVRVIIAADVEVVQKSSVLSLVFCTMRWCK